MDAESWSMKMMSGGGRRGYKGSVGGRLVVVEGSGGGLKERETVRWSGRRMVQRTKSW